MPLKEGTKLGPYEVLSPIGAGGMGEVYRARDTRLDRTVALKVLPSEMAGSDRRRERLDREARTISQLSHPHICALYDVGHQDGIDFLVMEYLEGETLGDRIRRKGPLPIDQVVNYAVQIAGALDKAHRHGVTHRDLKPGNIMLTATGAKLLDFGLAKLDAAGLDSLDSDDDEAGLLTAAPTEEKPLTAEGALLGTFRYMAPEQLEGKEADARADIWALGLVIYEMATGASVFQGSSQASLIAAIMEREPQRLATLRPETPPPLDRLVGRCLMKDPDERWQSARDLLYELEWIREGGSGATGAVGDESAPARRIGRERLLWAALVLVLAVSWILVLLTTQDRPDGPTHTARFSLPISQENAGISRMQISPDGRFFSYTADFEGQTHIWLRPIDSLEARPIPGTQDTRSRFHFWSPDSRSIGFIAEGQLRTVSIEGGPAEVLAEVPGFGPFQFGTWGREGTILYNIVEAPGHEGLYRVSEGGGDSTLVTILDETGEEVIAMVPSFLPDGRHFLFIDIKSEAIHVGSLETLQSFKILDFPSFALYAPPGYLLYARGGSLFAHRFDLDTLRPYGEPFRIAEGISMFGEIGTPTFSASTNGVLTYFTRGTRSSRLVLRDRNGLELEQIGEPDSYGSLDLSPDGKNLIVSIEERGGTRDLWIIELARGIRTRFTSDAFDVYGPVWSPDGSRVSFSMPVDAPPSMFVKPFGGGAATEVLEAPGTMQWASDWSPDGKSLIYSDRNPQAGWDLWVLPLAGDRQPVAFLNTRFMEFDGKFSPDGRFVAFNSDESGQPEIYVLPFEGPGEKRRVSTAGGISPRWSRDGKEIFYLDLDSRLMVVPVDLEGRFEPGIPKALFTAEPAHSDEVVYDVTGDGQRFILNEAMQGTDPPPTVVLDWTAELTP